MLLIVFQDNFVMQVMHPLMLYVYGTVVWHGLRVYVKEGVFNEMGTVSSHRWLRVIQYSMLI